MRERFSISDDYYNEEFSRETEEAVDAVSGNAYEPEKNVDMVGIDVEGKVPREKYDLVGGVTEELNALSDRLSHEIMTYLEEFCERESRPWDKIRGYVLNHNLQIPTFDIISDNSDINEYLDNNGLPELSSPSDCALVVFNLPKQMSRNWWKGGSKYWGTKAVDGDFFIEWGEIYRKIMFTVWDFIDQSMDNKIRYDRVNSVGTHEVDQYYYILRASKNKYYRPTETS